MSITIEDVIKLQHDKLTTIGSKLIYLSVLNHSHDGGWAAISINDFRSLTGLSARGVHNLVKKLVSYGMLEINPSKEHITSINEYRTIKQ